MLQNIPMFYRDELIYGWLIRYHRQSGNPTLEDTFQDMFNKNIFGSNRPIGNLLKIKLIDDLCSNLARCGVTKEDLLHNNTLIPLFKPFMSTKRYDKLMDTIGKQRDNSQLQLLGAEKIDLKYKICPICYKVDRELQGETWLKRENQIPEVKVCRKHNVNLIGLSYEEFLEIESRDEDDFIIEKNHDEKILELSRAVYDVLSIAKMQEETLDTIKVKYIKQLENKEYAYPGGKVNQQQLINDFETFYGEGFLKNVGFTIDKTDKKAWIKMLTSQQDIYIYPIGHILFIKFLFGSIDAFANFEVTEYRPFGKGPWPCLNPVCSCYKKSVIEDCQVSKYAKTGNPVGTFTSTCCGFTYSRQGPDKKIDDRFKVGRIKEYGRVWDKVLIELSQDGMPSVNALAKQMGCDNRAIVNQSIRLNINERFHIRKKAEETSKKGLKQEEIDAYKDEIILFINSNEFVKREDIKKALTKQYSTLYKKERKWCEEHFPAPEDAYESLIQSSESYWKEQDAKICQEIKIIIEDILSNNKAVRITKTYLAKQVKWMTLGVKQAESKIPKCKQLLDKHCETIKQYKERVENK